MESEMLRIAGCILATVLFGVLPAPAQEYDPSEVRLEIIPISDTIYKLQNISGTFVNSLALVGDEGVLLIDTGYPQTGEILRAETSKLGNGRVRIVVNTHEHNDHIGGNEHFAGDAVIISHARVREAYGGAYFALPLVERPGTPQVVFDMDLTIFFNGEEIRLRHYPAGHTLGDVVVHLTRSKIAFVGDMVFAGSFPGADLGRGGDLDRCLENVRKIIDDYPEETTFVSGHGPDYSRRDLEQYLEVGRVTRRMIEDELGKGKTVEQILASGLLDPWSDWGEGVISNEDWVTNVYQQYLKAKGEMATSISKPLTEALVAGGISGAVQEYRRLRDEEPPKHDFAENHLNTLGYQLLNRNMVGEAIAIFRLNVEAYPESGNVYDSLAEAYMTGGENDLAIENYRRSLDKDPGNGNARAMLKRLGHEEESEGASR
jgi:glyoxylase-like metal-dependent hydrolase (beta-lactamase superfamily II)